jgi:hypothetical protein
MFGIDLNDSRPFEDLLRVAADRYEEKQRSFDRAAELGSGR